MEPADRPDGSALSAHDVEAALLALTQEFSDELHRRRRAPRPLTLDSSLDSDVGLDSLARVELLARVERRFGVALPESTYASAETPRDLLRAVLSASGRAAYQAALPVAPVRLAHAAAAPEEAATMIDVLNWHVQAQPDRPHIRLYGEGGRVITYAQLRRGAEGVAAGLQQLGLAPGEAVAIMLPTGADYFFSFLGILLAGGVPVPIYPPARRSQLEEHLRRHGGILANCLAATLITVPEARVLARLLRGQVESLRNVVTAADLMDTAAALQEPVLAPQDTAFLQYTSGSTGNPKGVVLNHTNLLTNIRAMGAEVRASSDDVFVSWLPLYHDMGLIGAWFGSLYYCLPLVLMSPLEFLTRPRRWLEAIHQNRATLSAAPNFAYELCLRRVSDADMQGLDLSSWRIAFNGAEQVSPATIRRFSERFGRFGFHADAMTPVYGLAESTLGVTFPPRGRGPVTDRIYRERFMRTGEAVRVEGEADAGTVLEFVGCGHPLPQHEIRVVDEDDRELPDRQQGHLHFRGPSCTSGYFRNPEATARLFHDDWLDSGDLAYVADGELFVTGRVKDVVIHAGRNIYPDELEEAVGNIEDIRKGCVAVFGAPDPRNGTERLIVMAETREVDAVAQERLRVRINSVTAAHTGTPPDDVVLVPPHTVLKTSSGKIRRAASRELYERGQLEGAQRAVAAQVLRLALASLRPRLRSNWRRMLATLYAAYVWAAFALAGSLVFVGVLLLPHAGARWRFSHRGARLLTWLTATRLAVNGIEHLPAPGVPCVLVANHASYVDGLVLVAALPQAFGFVAKAEFQSNPVVGTFLRRIGTYFVERFDPRKSVADARRTAEAVRAGRRLLFFPEGTFTRMPGLLPFQMGAFVAAAEAGVPVIPVTLRGTRSMLRSESWFPRRTKITVTIGTPILPAELAMPEEGNSWSLAVRLRDAAHAAILRSVGEPDLWHQRPLRTPSREG